MDIFDNIKEALRFKDTIFYKENSELQDRYNALIKLKEEYPNNKKILNEFNNIKKGLDGENEIAYQLKKANLGLYVLRDVKVKYEDLTAQIDYIVITPVFIYYIECKNLYGNIFINEKGDFIREFNYNGKKVRKGMYSPLRQVEAQREVIRKIWESKISSLKKIMASKNFDYYRRVLVITANKDTILNTYKAPNDIKNKVLRADTLIRKIKYDYNNADSNVHVYSQSEMKKVAKLYMDICINEDTDYYKYYKDKLLKDVILSDDNLKDKLIKFRKDRSCRMNLPAYYVFTNEELDKLVLLRPKTLNDLKTLNILSEVKIKIHGKEIIDEINK